MHSKRQFGQNVVLSLSGSILPALVGVVGTVLLVRTAPESASVTILTAWTLLGYMVLSDLGLTRSSSKLLSSGTDPAVAVGTLWRTALPLGLVLSLITGALAVLVSPYLALLIPVPILTTLQFPVAGALEASGQFAVLAGQRLVNALSVYLIPPLTVAVLGVEQGLIVGFSVVLVARIGLFWYLLSHLSSTLRMTVRALFDRTLTSQAHLVFWVGVSSVVGPAFLYADRVAVSLGEFSNQQWIDYTALSELLLKSYVIPSAVLAVVFPWLATRAMAHLPRLRALVTRWLPLTALVGAAVVVTAGLLIPREVIAEVLPLVMSDDGRNAMIILLTATGLNWISQMYIAVLQAFDRQKVVAIWQIAFAVPFLAALMLASFTGSLAAIAWVAFGRILVLCVVLALSARRALLSGS